MLRISSANLVSGSAITASSEDTNYPALNIRTPQRPFMPARTTATGDQWWVVDFGSQQTVDTWGIIRGNFTSCKIQANATDAWGAPSFDSGFLTIGRNPYNGRYQRCYRPTIAQAYRYNRLFVPAQATTDGAGYYRLGGFWAGISIAPPRDIMWHYHVTTEQPRQDREPDHKGWMQRINMGDPYTTIKADRTILTGQTAQGSGPGNNDELAAWFDFERQWELVDFALVMLRDDNPTLTWIMRRSGIPEWDVDYGWSESTSLELLEVMR